MLFLASVRHRFGVGLASGSASLWGLFGVGLGSVWGQSGVSLASVCRFGLGLESVWDQFGVTRGSVWGQFGIGPRPIWEFGGACNTPCDRRSRIIRTSRTTAGLMFA